MEITTIDGQPVPAWTRPGSSEPAGKPHALEEDFEDIRVPGIELDTASVPEWQRSFIDPELHRLAPLVAGVKDAISRASHVSQDFKPEARVKRQEEILAPALHALGNACAKLIEDQGGAFEAVEAFAQQLPEAPKGAGNDAVIFAIRASEVRRELKAMRPDERLEAVKGAALKGDLLPLQACMDSFVPLLSAEAVASIKRERIRTLAPWVDRKREDFRALLGSTYKTARTVYGAASAAVHAAFGEVKSPPSDRPSEVLTPGVKIPRPASLEAVRRFEPFLGEQRRTNRGEHNTPEALARHAAALRRVRV